MNIESMSPRARAQKVVASLYAKELTHLRTREELEAEISLEIEATEIFYRVRIQELEEALRKVRSYVGRGFPVAAMAEVARVIGPDDYGEKGEAKPEGGECRT